MNLTARLVRDPSATDAHLVISLTAPASPGPARPPFCVIPVIDVSGSMGGEKLRFARASVARLVDHLSSDDWCGLVAFSSEVELLSEVRAISGPAREALRSALTQLQPRDDTNLSGALIAALDLARSARLPPGVPVRVIVFTDGLPNAGPVTSSSDLCALLRDARGAATLSAFGYGEDADQELLRDLSTAAGGNYAFVKAPEDALNAFARELGGLLSLSAQKVRIRVQPLGGVQLTNVISDVDARPIGEGVLLELPELLAEETRHLVLALRVQSATSPLLRVECELERFDGARFVPLTLGEEVQAATPVDPELDAIIATAQLIRAQIDAETAARSGHFDKAVAVMLAFEVSAGARGHHSLSKVAGKLAAALRDGSEYEQSRSYRASLRKGMNRNVGGTFHKAAAEDLASAGRAKATRAQVAMEESFGKPSGSPKLTRRRARRF